MKFVTDISASGNGDVNMVGEEGTEKGEPVQVSREELQLKALKAVKNKCLLLQLLLFLGLNQSLCL